MHVGMSAIFQGFGGSMSDQEVWAADLRLADLAEPLGYESIWSVEHHFSDYTMCPDVLQFLTYMAGRTTTVKLGSMVLVLPWHDPVRAAEQIILLDHMSNGRLILGLGRGTGKIEFDGFRTDMAIARQQFKESAEAILDALETGSWSTTASSSTSRASSCTLPRTPRSRGAPTRRRSHRSRPRSWPSSAPAC